MTLTLSWSQWWPLERGSITGVPERPGVYEISCQAASCIVFIGSAAGRGGLRQRLGQRVNAPERNLSAYEKRLRKQGCRLMFRYAESDSGEQARDWESVWINKYKRHHGHLPPGNTVTPHRAPPAISSNEMTVREHEP